MKRFRFLLVVMASLLATLAIVGWMAFRATQSVPSFYEAVLAMEPIAADQAGDELEQQVLSLHNDLEAGERWCLQLDDRHVNGWLSSDLKEKFPDLLPSEVREPRIVFTAGQAHVACQLQTRPLKSILSIVLEASLTKQPNQIAIRIQRVRAGRLPVPLGNILAQIADAVRNAGIACEWTQEEGDPVALVTLPTNRSDLRQGVVLEHLEFGDGQLTISGTAKPETPRVADNDQSSETSQNGSAELRRN